MSDDKIIELAGVIGYWAAWCAFWFAISMGVRSTKMLVFGEHKESK